MTAALSATNAERLRERHLWAERAGRMVDVTSVNELYLRLAGAEARTRHLEAALMSRAVNDNNNRPPGKFDD